MHKASIKWSCSAALRLSLSIIILGIASAPLSAASNATEPMEAMSSESVAGAAFDRLKTLEGTWRIANNNDHPLRISFYPTAGGSTLVESWEVNGRSHSLTIYHRDGGALLATHYCPQGNQPRMELSQSAEGQLSFTFRDATDLDMEHEQYQHSLAFNMEGADRIVRSEDYRDGDGNMHPSQLVLERVSKN